MRQISAETIRKKVYDLILQASYHIGDDVCRAVSEARDGRVLEAIRERLPLFDTDLVDAVAQINRDFARGTRRAGPIAG